MQQTCAHRERPRPTARAPPRISLPMPEPRQTAAHRTATSLMRCCCCRRAATQRHHARRRLPSLIGEPRTHPAPAPPRCRCVAGRCRRPPVNSHQRLVRRLVVAGGCARCYVVAAAPFRGCSLRPLRSSRPDMKTTIVNGGLRAVCRCIISRAIVLQEKWFWIEQRTRRQAVSPGSPVVPAPISSTRCDRDKHKSSAAFVQSIETTLLKHTAMMKQTCALPNRPPTGTA